MIIISRACCNRGRVGAIVVKFYEWRQGVLHGPYLARERAEEKRRQ
jgi:hypothetical protein